MIAPEVFLGGRVVLHCGDSREVLRTLPDASIHAVVCDPPYALVSIGKRFGKPGAAPAQHGRDGLYARASAGFMGQGWDTGETAFAVEFWAEVLRVLKPGGHVVAFGGTRSFHRLACAIEDAGFELRDQLAWAYGAGFPKSHNVSRRLDGDRCACEGPSGAVSDLQCDLRPVRDGHVSPAVYHEDECGEVLLASVSQHGASRSVLRAKSGEGGSRAEEQSMEGRCDAPTSQGQLRPGPIYSLPAGSHLDGTSGRICDGASPCDGEVDRATIASGGVRSSSRSSTDEQRTDELGALAGQSEPQARGAWPHCARCGKPIVPDGLGTALKPAWEPIVLARKPLDGTVAANVLAHGTGALNIDGGRVEAGDKTPAPVGQFGGSEIGPTGLRGVRDGSADALGRWPANVLHDGSPEVVGAFPETSSSPPGNIKPSPTTANAYGEYSKRSLVGHTDAGSAARFFYSSKADADDRLGSKHPTVKPVDLMQWLCRLVTPPGGTVLDPFAGTGTTGEAAWREGFSAVLIEREAQYQEDIRRRMKLALGGPDERKRESIKARHGDVEAGPLFAGPRASQEAAE